ncbi:DUF1573 domain-containing protein [Candidatus Bipolaricaulota bacterium]|nr:DUF1573 domain-containing protein [Candidatus Bipolaricaulota bacterium]
MNISRKTLYFSGTLAAAGLTVALLFIFVIGGNGTAAGEIVVRPVEYDLGDVDYGGGIVKREFSLENQGESVLKLNSIKTSCGCTEAQLVYTGKRSKNFGMDPNNLLWSEEIQPKDQATLEVFYDPTTHGTEGVGPFRRSIWIESSDPGNENVEVNIKGSVVR